MIRSPPGAFRADGMYGQFCVVHPATDTILVTNCLTQNMGGVLEFGNSPSGGLMAVVRLRQPQDSPQPRPQTSLLKKRRNNT